MAKELAVLQDGKTDPCLIPRFLFQAFPCGVPSSLGPPVSSFSRHVQNIVHKYSMSKLPCYHCDGLICPRYFLDEEKKSVNIRSPVCPPFVHCVRKIWEAQSHSKMSLTMIKCKQHE